VDRTISIQDPAAVHVHDDSAFAEEDGLWGPIADEWAENCRRCDDVLRCRGENNVSTCLAEALTEKLQVKRARRKREKVARKERKRTAGNAMLRVATQNFNGGAGEAKMEEAVSNMKQRDIGILCGQEGRRKREKMERWDSGEILLPASAFLPTSIQSAKKKDGNFILLDANWGKAYVKGGKRVKSYGPRLMATWLPLQQNKKWLCLINVHFPDGGKLKSEKDAFWRDFETCVSKADESDIMVVVGDFNASMGVSTGDYDLVCGNEGIPCQNENGRRLKSFAGMQDLVDLVSWEKQTLPATRYDTRTRAGRQLDRVLMRQSDRDMVVACSNFTVLVDSDHEAVVVTSSLAFDAPKHKTVRSTRSRKDIAIAFVETAESTCGALLDAAVTTIETLEDKKRGEREWWDGDDALLTEAVLLRNQCSRVCAKSKTAANL
jgi:exonuclease III